jgi:hypothetical protein
MLKQIVGREMCTEHVVNTVLQGFSTGSYFESGTTLATTVPRTHTFSQALSVNICTVLKFVRECPRWLIMTVKTGL